MIWNHDLYSPKNVEHRTLQYQLKDYYHLEKKSIKLTHIKLIFLNLEKNELRIIRLLRRNFLVFRYKTRKPTLVTCLPWGNSCPNKTHKKYFFNFPIFYLSKKISRHSYRITISRSILRAMDTSIIFLRLIISFVAFHGFCLGEIAQLVMTGRVDRLFNWSNALWSPNLLATIRRTMEA